MHRTTGMYVIVCFFGLEQRMFFCCIHPVYLLPLLVSSIVASDWHSWWCHEKISSDQSSWNPDHINHHTKKKHVDPFEQWTNPDLLIYTQDSNTTLYDQDSEIAPEIGTPMNQPGFLMWIYGAGDEVVSFRSSFGVVFLMQLLGCVVLTSVWVMLWNEWRWGEVEEAQVPVPEIEWDFQHWPTWSYGKWLLKIRNPLHKGPEESGYGIVEIGHI